MKVTSTKSISFPPFDWGISAGEIKELPDNEEAVARILSEPEIVLLEPADPPKGETANKVIK